MNIFELQINEDLFDESGVFTVSVVRDPAIEMPVQFFNKTEKMKFRVVNDQQRIAFGPVLLADHPIYRNNDAFGEHYIQFSADTVKKIMQKYFRTGSNKNTNLEHNPLLSNDNVVMYESFQVDRERGIMPPNGYDTVKDGSWFASLKVFDEELWMDIKEGNYTGFSVEGNFSYVVPDEEYDDDLDALLSEIEQLIEKMDTKNEK